MTMADPAGMTELVQSLEQELAELQKKSKTSRIAGSVIGVVVAGYLLFAYTQIAKLTDPTGLAEAATGAVIDRTPQITEALRSAAVDGAPALARHLSTSVVETIPTYRAVLETELIPVIDEVCAIIANVAVTKMEESASDKMLDDNDQQVALQAAANEVIERLDTVLKEALDEPDEDGGTPRHMIVRSLRELKTIDTGLKDLAKGRGGIQERQLVMGWLNLVTQFENESNAAAAEQYRAQGGIP
jgi:hypothetical protein